MTSTDGASDGPGAEERPTSAAASWLAEPAGKAAVILAAAAAGIITMVAAGWRPVLRLDRQVAVDLHAVALEHPGLTYANRVLTDWVWDPWTMRLLLAAAAIGLWRHRQRWLALWTVGTSAAEAGVRQVLRWAIGRERPHWERPVDSADFAALPSGHAMTAAAASVLLLWLARRGGFRPGLWRLALTMAVVTVAGSCFTRIFLGVHWLTDTLAGALLGTALTTAAIAAWHIVTGARSSSKGLPRQRADGYRETTSDADI